MPRTFLEFHEEVHNVSYGLISSGLTESIVNQARNRFLETAHQTSRLSRRQIEAILVQLYEQIRSEQISARRNAETAPGPEALINRVLSRNNSNRSRTGDIMNKQQWEVWKGDGNPRHISYNARFVGKKHKSYGEKPLYFIGAELECYFQRQEAFRHVFSILERDLGEYSFIFKHDGSIGGAANALEIVTSPRSFMSWDQLDLEKTFRELRKLGLRSWESQTCGIHLHFTKHPQRRQELIIKHTLIQFFIDNKDKLLKLSRRGQHTGHCAFHNDAGTYGDNRYSAVNFQAQHTVEFRFPRGTLNDAAFRAYIQFCNCVYELCWKLADAKAQRSDSHDYDAVSLSWQAVLRQIDKRRKTCIEAKELLIGLGLWDITLAEFGIPPEESINRQKELAITYEKVRTKADRRANLVSKWDNKFRVARQKARNIIRNINGGTFAQYDLDSRGFAAEFPLYFSALKPSDKETWAKYEQKAQHYKKRLALAQRISEMTRRKIRESEGELILLGYNFDAKTPRHAPNDLHHRPGAIPQPSTPGYDAAIEELLASNER